MMLCSEIVEAYPQIAEMNLNPVIVHQKGLSIVDARVILKSDDECRMSEDRCRMAEVFEFGRGNAEVGKKT